MGRRLKYLNIQKMRMHLLWKTICKLSSDRKTFAGFCKGKQNAIKFKCVSEKHKSDTFLSERRI